MKTLHLGIIIILATSLGISTSVAFADDINSVQIQNIQVQPSTITVGDNFNITATLVNNSTGTISVHNDCLSPFSVTFSHATVDVEKPCIYFAISKLIKPGENITVTGPGSNIAYRATDAGVANATITFSYTDENQTSSNTSVNPSNLSKSILFTILPQSAQTTPPILDPLQQFRSGTLAKDVKCGQGFELIIRSENDIPACVKYSSVQKLVDWGLILTKLSIDDLNKTYGIGEEINSTINFQGIMHYCDYPRIQILDSNQNIVLKSKERDLMCVSNPFIPLPYMIERLDLDSEYGGPIIINDTCTYTLKISPYGNDIEKQFAVGLK